ncbi:MAG: hypothetical protein K2L13_03985 [Opitutales bacterium]|nr:hypothetical protein [Opitutales bacterium]
MVRIVQKYGGTSVADTEHIKSVAEHIKSCREHGDELIVVLSARAGVTNMLVEKAHSVSSLPDREALDALLYTGELETIAMLALILNEMGVPAVPRNAYQIGISTCSSFGNARIEDIIGGDIEQCLAEKKVVIVAGFQGIDQKLRPTTLGRGGSDLTAIALAHRFGADKCEIFTDVDGVFSADPRIISAPYLISDISHDALLRLTFFDNKVMQDRSVALAKKLRVNFEISSSLHYGTLDGTSVKLDWKCNEGCVIGLTYKQNLVLFCGLATNDIFCDLLEFFADKKIDLSFIKHSFCPKRTEFLDELCFDFSQFWRIREEFLSKFAEKYQSYELIENLSRIDVVGTGLEYSEWLSQALTAVYDNMIFRSEYGKNGLSFLMKSENFGDIMNKLHDIVFK